MAEKSDLYDFKTTLFLNGDPEEFLLFLQNFQMTLKASGTLADGANIPYLCTVVRGEALRRLDTFYVEVGSTTTDNLNLISLVLGTYCFPVNGMSKQNRATHRRMRKPRGLKVRRCAAPLIGLNEYLDTFPGAKKSNKICDTELNEILLNSMPNS